MLFPQFQRAVLCPLASAATASVASLVFYLETKGNKHLEKPTDTWNFSPPVVIPVCLTGRSFLSRLWSRTALWDGGGGDGVLPLRVGLCGARNGPAGGCSGPDHVLLLGLLLDHLVIGWWRLNQERHTHTNAHAHAHKIIINYNNYLEERTSSSLTLTCYLYYAFTILSNSGNWCLNVS